MSPSGGSYVLTFPPCSSNHVHYVYENSGPIAVGQTTAMTYSISGAATFQAPGDSLPATLHLFLQRQGDDLSGDGPKEFYRLWAARMVLEVGSFNVSQVLQPPLWTGVFGRNPTAAQFADTLGNLAHVGFTFGGSSFAGYGVCANSPTTFASYDVR
jgi:hypothetical protein